MTVKGILVNRPVTLGRRNKRTARLVNNQAANYPPVSKDGWLAGEAPNLVTEDGVPTIAEIYAVVRGSHIRAGHTTSQQDGTWQINGLNPDTQYDVIYRKDTYNDIIVSDVTPIAEPKLRVKQVTVTNGTTDIDLPPNFYGGEGEITATVVDGSLPLTVTLHENHLVSSEVNAPIGEYPVTIELTSGRYTIQQTLTVVVRSEFITIDRTDILSNYDIEETITPINIKVTGGRPPYIINVSGLPVGLSYNNGEISGTVDAINNNTQYFPLIKVTDADGLFNKRTAITSVGGDPHWGSVKTLCHFDGTVDTLEPTTMYSAYVDADAKFGAGSLAVNDGNNGMLLNEPMNAGGDLTIEFWYKFNTRSDWMSYLGDWNDNNNDVVMMVGATHTILKVNNTEIYHSGTTRYPDGLPPSEWHHCAIVRADGVWLMFLNGLKLFERTGLPLFNYSRGRRLLYSQTARYRLNKRQMDEVRFSYTARYTDDFIPPTAPFYNFGK